MPLSLEQLQRIQAEALADDLEIDFERMSSWTEAMAISYFESGEEPAPPPQPDPALVELLARVNLEHLIEAVSDQTVDKWAQIYRYERPRFLPLLKELGVTKLAERQMIRDCIRTLVEKSPARRPRALCLHGRCTNGGFITKLVENFVKPLREACDLIPLDAPYAVPQDMKDAYYRTLCAMCPEPHLQFFNAVDGFATLQHDSDEYEALMQEFGEMADRVVALVAPGFGVDQLEVSVSFVREAMVANAPIDGVICFSNGCMPAAIAVRQMMREPELSQEALNLKFACFFSGYLPQNLPLGHRFATCLESQPCNVPTLHVLGLEDELVSRSLNEEFQRKFSDTSYQVKFQGGHEIPNLVKYPDASKGIQDFVNLHVHS
ncbi:hypothetical protein AB1Y20_000767 [Prymnesium parvum]|uniref:Serine hydrolase domain-containing protein n=1 Tax=Prymnesium parvum TaxID=97485 RepID=A0AB34K6T8_PRYPA